MGHGENKHFKKSHIGGEKNYLSTTKECQVGQTKGSTYSDSLGWWSSGHLDFGINICKTNNKYLQFNPSDSCLCEFLGNRYIVCPFQVVIHFLPVGFSVHCRV